MRACACVGGLVRDCSVSKALAMEMLRPCAEPSTCGCTRVCTLTRCMSMAWCGTAMCPVRQQWTCCGLARIHRHEHLKTNIRVVHQGTTIVNLTSLSSLSTRRSSKWQPSVPPATVEMYDWHYLVACVTVIQLMLFHVTLWRLHLTYIKQGIFWMDFLNGTDHTCISMTWYGIVVSPVRQQWRCRSLVLSHRCVHLNTFICAVHWAAIPDLHPCRRWRHGGRRNDNL